MFIQPQFPTHRITNVLRMCHTVTQSQQYNVFSSRSDNQSQHDDVDALLSLFTQRRLPLTISQWKIPLQLRSNTTPGNASTQLKQQFVADDLDSRARSKTEKCSRARNHPTAIAKKSKKLYGLRASNAKLRSKASN